MPEMFVKGSAVKTTQEFVQRKFGDEKFKLWMGSLSPEAREHFTSAILVSSWYPMETAFVQPSRVMIDLFYSGSHVGLREVGAYSADQGLRGVRKIFVRMNSPKFLLKKIKHIYLTYYRPSHVELVEMTDHYARCEITQFPETSGLVEQRVAGWMEKALEISGCKEVKVGVPRSLSRGDPHIEIEARWK